MSNEDTPVLHPDRDITVPIATSCTRSATISLPWFVNLSQYSPRECNFAPLVNGETAFGAIHDAICQARTSIDIICWGFQPSMYFKRGRIANNLTIGQLLEKKAQENVKVRLLRWKSIDNGAAFLEDPAPGATPTATAVDHASAAWQKKPPKDLRTAWQQEFDTQWYRRAGTAGDPARRPPGNLICATRDMDLSTRLRIAAHADKDTPAGIMSVFPSHHQKMVLIDYETPAHAVGFVMGHNMLDAYWDTDGHNATRCGPAEGRNGATPRQDISSRVRGPILDSLNRNFCQAWDDATGDDLTARRKDLNKQLSTRRAGADDKDSDVILMAQILLTHPQPGKLAIPPTPEQLTAWLKYREIDIQRAYAQAVNNTTSYLYIENQYFRYPKLAAQIKAAIERQVSCGRPTDRYPIHLFVVTNATDEGIGPGTLRTYELLSALGRPDAMPGIALENRKDDLQQQYQEACNAEVRARLKGDLIAGNRSMLDTPAQRQAQDAKIQAAQAQQKQARDKQAALKKQMEEVTRQQQDIRNDPDAGQQHVLPTATPGLKVHICSLVAPDSPAHHWQPVYIHSKLMLIDDVFTTLGSANINVRSMEGDSELNICHETGRETRKLRKQLWNLHTGNRGAQDNVPDAFDAWGKIIDKNKINRAKKLTPHASLMGFLYTGTERKSID